MEVRYPRPVVRKWYSRLCHLGVLGLLVRVVPHHEAEEEAGHDDVAQPQHGEVAGGVGGGEDQFPGQRQVRSIASDGAANSAE